MDKATLRAKILTDFATISEKDRRRWGEMIAERVLALPELVCESGPLMLFLSMPDELDTDPLVRVALDAGFELCAPRTLQRSRRLEPRRLACLDDVKAGVYGIREPTGEECFEPESLGAVIVPAVAYDRDGWRLGRGGGFYDRFLERLSPGAVTCGVILSRYLLDSVPRESHDLPVQIIVTEEEVLRTGKKE